MGGHTARESNRLRGVGDAKAKTDFLCGAPEKENPKGRSPKKGHLKRNAGNVA